MDSDKRSTHGEFIKVEQCIQPSSVDYHDSSNMFDGSNIISSMPSTHEAFNNSYTDTITSVSSTDYLIQPYPDGDGVSEKVKDIFYNKGFVVHNGNQGLHKSEVENSETVLCQDAHIKGPPFLNNESFHLQRDANIQNYEPDTSIQLLEKLFTSFPDPVVGSHRSPNVDYEEEAKVPLLCESQQGKFAKITNNLVVVDESFLFQSQINLTDPELNIDNKRAPTMQNLHERSSFLDLTEVSKVGRACQKALIFLKDDLTLGSLASLNNMAAKDLETSQSLDKNPYDLNVIPSGNHKQNLVALSISITLMFIAVGSVRNLQSSLNQAGGVGIISMAVSFVGYMVGSVISITVVQRFQPWKCVVINLIPNLLYVAANIYPTMWLMTPVSLAQGVSMAIIWNAMSTYITLLSRGEAQKQQESFEKVSSHFFGIFCLIYQSYHVIGNLISSLVLISGSSGGPLNNTKLAAEILNTSVTLNQQDEVYLPVDSVLPADFEAAAVIEHGSHNFSLIELGLCGANFCSNYKLNGAAVSVANETKYILFSVYMACILLSMVIAGYFLEPLNEKYFTSDGKPFEKLKQQLISLSKFVKDVDFLLMLPLLMYSLMQFGFISADVTMAFVTCPLGIHMVGYSMICYGICGSFSSYLSGLFSKCICRAPLFIFAAILNFCVLMFMSQWQPSLDSLIPYFIMIGTWGLADGIWISQVNCLVGIIFPDKYEEAYAGLRVAQGLGVAILFGYSNSLCMTVKIYIMLAFCIFALTLYLIMEGLLKHRNNQKTIVFELKQTSV
ncbi:unnamed protein product [Lymnaea stagnalis]|uniref:UNC93-like protein n=1 Tax=Lymnaea stagnalis TaxID=6523 RepID=A0AAV2HHV3_LYMST